MNTRTVKFLLSPPDGSLPREVECSGDTVTLYAKYGPEREFVVMPDVCGFKLHVGRPDSISPLVCIDFDDGRIIIRWNDGSGNFKVSRPTEGTVLITPVQGKE